MPHAATPPAPPADAPRLFAPRLALLFAAVLVPNGVFIPYFPLWLEWTGLSPGEIAVVLGAPMFLRVATTPPIASFADRAGDRATVLVATVAASLVLSLGFFLPPSYALALALSLGLAVVWPVQNTIADAIALSGVRRFGADYSRMRVWGSASFLVANLGGGLLLARTGPDAVPAMFSAGLAATLVASLLVPRLGRTQGGNGRQSAGPLTRRPRLMLFMAAVGLIQASHALLYGFSSILWKTLGLSDGTIGALWAWGVLMEVALFLVFTRVFGRWSPLAIVALAGIAAVARWCLFPLVWPAGLGLSGFFAVQAMHALSTGLLIVGIQQMIAQSVPEEQTGAAQGIAFFATNLGLAAATLLSGSLYASFGAGGFFAMALIAGAGLAFTALAARSAP